MKTASHPGLPDKPVTALAMAIALIALAAGFRLLRATLLPELPNFSPVMALAICGALVLPGRLALLIPLIALIVTDLLLNFRYGVALFSLAGFIGYLCYGIGVATGVGLRRHEAGAPLVLGAVAGNSLLFYLVTNFLSWLGNPSYAQTAAGLVQALTVGIPGLTPTWMFFRNSLVSDLVFTGLFLAAMYFASPARRAQTGLVRA